MYNCWFVFIFCILLQFSATKVSGEIKSRGKCRAKFDCKFCSKTGQSFGVGTRDNDFFEKNVEKKLSPNFFKFSPELIYNY